MRDVTDDDGGQGISVQALPHDAPDRRDAHRAASAARMRLSRARQRDGLRVIAFQIRESEVAELMRLGLLPDAARHDRDAIARALGRLLDKMLP